jgi:hypothetical protein
VHDRTVECKQLAGHWENKQGTTMPALDSPVDILGHLGRIFATGEYVRYTLLVHIQRLSSDSNAFVRHPTCEACNAGNRSKDQGEAGKLTDQVAL